MNAFATHGELLKLLYNAFGLLPRRGAGDDDFDETDKKTLQTRLRRLADESGDLVENYGRAIKAFQDLLKKYLPVPGQVAEVSSVLHDLDAIYARTIREEGTFLDGRASLQYFISTKAVPNLVLGLSRSLLLCGAYTPGTILEDHLFWYLPSRQADGTVKMPLATVMHWAYRQCGVSQKRFHHPRAPLAGPAPLLEQNLDSAVRWVSGKRMPTLHALLANFRESFAALAAHGQPVEQALQERILTALTFARVASFLATELRSHYGDAYLDDVCAQIRESMGLLQRDVGEFLQHIGPGMDATPPEARSAAWLRACLHHEEFVREKLMMAAGTLMELREAAPDRPFRPDTLAALCSRLGVFAVHANLDQLARIDAIAVPPGFAELLYAGLDLRRDPDTTLAQVAEFDERVRVADLQEVLCWLSSWLRGAVHYRKGDFAAAFVEIGQAFELAKYRAGRDQYTLVNQYVELAAKNDNAVAFRKGVDWAAYIGLELRWLRDREPTEENLANMRQMMKMANYSHQL